MDLRAFPFIRLVLFLIIGIIGFEYLAIGNTLIIVLSILAILLACLGLFSQNSFSRNIGIYLGLISLGWLSAKIGSEDLAKIPFQKYEAYQVRVSSNTESKPKSYKVMADVYQVKSDSTWHKAEHKVLLYFTKEIESRPSYGDTYLINEAPREIEGPKNPFEFDYKNFQKRRGITVHHFLRKGGFKKLGNHPENNLLKWAYSMNSLAAEKLKSVLPDQSDLAVADAMLLGTKDELDNDTRDAYATAGAVHILAVSGLHVGILMMMLNLVFGFLDKSRKTKWLYGLITISCLWAYALFTGLSPSVTRATLMFSLFQLGSLIQRDKNSINVLAGSAFILLLIKPFWLFEVGFQLSYLAIFGILYLYPYLNNLIQPKSWILTKLWQISIVSIAAQLFTFPLSIYYFHQFPSYFLLTNPIVTVLSTLVLFFGLPSLLLSSIPYLSIISNFTFWILKAVLKVLNYAIFAVAALPESKLSGFSLSLTEVVILYLFLFLAILFFLKKELKYFKAGLILFIGLSGFNIYKDHLQKDQKEITFHFIPKAPGISLISSKTATFITDSATAQNDRAYGFHLKNYYDERGIKSHEIKTYNKEDKLLTFNVGNNKYLWIRTYYRGKVTEAFEKVLISNNSIYNIEKQFQPLPKELILDDTNAKYRITSLKSQADSLGIKITSLYETGGLTYSLK